MNARAQAVVPARTAELAAIVDLTLAIRERIAASDWGKASELDLTRRAALHRLFDALPPERELPELVATLKDVVRLNEEIIGLVAHQRRALDRQVDLLNAGQRAANAYLAP